MKPQTERALFWWVIIGLLVIFWGAVAWMCAENANAQSMVILEWGPPTHRTGVDAEGNPNCEEEGAALTPEDTANLLYTVSYRIKGANEWVNEDSITPTITLSLPYGETFQATVGAHWPGGSVICATGILEFTTSFGPPAGPCSAFRKVGE